MHIVLLSPFSSYLMTILFIIVANFIGDQLILVVRRETSITAI